jgi:hypothetical protein
VTELTRDRQVNPETFGRMAKCYSERAICEIVWLVASEHFYNMTNIGLNISFRYVVRHREEANTGQSGGRDFGLVH